MVENMIAMPRVKSHQNLAVVERWQVNQPPPLREVTVLTPISQVGVTELHSAKGGGAENLIPRGQSDSSYSSISPLSSQTDFQFICIHELEQVSRNAGKVELFIVSSSHVVRKYNALLIVCSVENHSLNLFLCAESSMQKTYRIVDCVHGSEFLTTLASAE